MSISSLFLDIAVVAIFIGCMIYYGIKGFLASLLDFFGTVISLALSAFLCSRLATLIYENFFRARFLENTLHALEEQGAASLGDVLGQILGFLPDSLVESLAQAYEGTIEALGPQAATFVVDNVVAPVIIPLIAVIVFLVVFLALRLLIGILGAVLKNANKIPLVGGVNRVLGVVAGILIATLYSGLLICVIWIIDASFGAELIGQQYFGQSIVYRLTQGWNFFA